MSRSPLGKLIAVHTASPASLQRAMVAGLLAFAFGVGMLLGFALRAHFLYLVLAASFMTVAAFTLAGYLVQKRRNVTLYARGLKYRSHIVFYSDITDVAREQDSGLAVSDAKGVVLTLPPSVHRLEDIEAFIRTEIA